MKIGKTMYVVTTLSGEVISIRYSKSFVKADVEKAEKVGHECVVVESVISAIHTKN